MVKFLGKKVKKKVNFRQKNVWENFQKFDLSAGTRGEKIREGPQGPSYAKLLAL